MSDPTEIYLQPECCADDGVGRIWCDHDAPVDCEDGVPWTKYVLAARVRELEAELAREKAAVYDMVEACKRAEAERDAVAVANCPRLCDQFCNEYQTQRALERAEAERDALRALLLKSYCYVAAHVPIGVKTDNDRKVLMLDIDAAIDAALKESP